MPLNATQLDHIGECLSAAVHGPFFPDGEFCTLFGLTREEVCAVANEWPLVTSHERTRVAVGATLNNLCGYPSKHLDKWDEYLSLPRESVPDLIQAWRESQK